MTGLLLKDLQLIRASCTMANLFPLIIVLASCIAGSRQSLFLATIIVSLLCAMQPMCTLDYDVSENWQNLRHVLNFSTISEIASKYVLCLLFQMLSLVTNIALTNITLTASNASAASSLTLCAMAFFISSCYIAFNVPVMYRFGMEKARVVLFSILACTVLIPVLFQAFPAASTALNAVRLPQNPSLILLGISFVLLAMSAVVSYRMVAQQELGVN